MRLATTIDEQFGELMAWFSEHRSCSLWGGPHFRFPFTDATFRQDTRRDEMPSYSLLGASGEQLGFGQFYPRVGRCHLCRLAIEPAHRGRGLGGRLIRGLVEIGCDRLSTDQCSLFVDTDNLRALRLYRRVGFALTPYPEKGFELPGCVYMTAAMEQVMTE